MQIRSFFKGNCRYLYNQSKGICQESLAAIRDKIRTERWGPDVTELAQQCQQMDQVGDGIRGLAKTHLGTGDKVISVKPSMCH